MPNFSLSIDSLKIFWFFKSNIIPKLFLIVKGVTYSEMKGIHSNLCLCPTSSQSKTKAGQNNKYCIHSAKVNLQKECYGWNTQKYQVLTKPEPCIIHRLLLNYSDSEH